MQVAFPVLFPWFARRAPERVAERSDPPLPTVSQPVFIHDAITPWRGETLLSVRLRADLQAALDQADSRQD